MVKNKNEIRLAVIGVGYWGLNLVRVFSRLGVLYAICDSDPNKLIEAKKVYPKVNTTLSYADILNDKTISAVVISTPAESHYNLAKEALFVDKDVFVEKPLALNMEEGRELMELSEKNKKILMVGHLLEYHPAINKLRELIKRGKLGKIQYIYSNRLNLGIFRRNENILWSFAPHDISVMLLLLNEIPESVSVFGGEYLHRGIADVTVSNLSFISGVRGHIFVSWLHPYKEQKLVVVGDKKMAVFDDIKEQEKLLIYSHKIDWINGNPIPKKDCAKRIKFKTGEPLFFECKHFLNCLKTRKIPKTSAKSALKILQVLQACQMSLDKGGIPILLNSFSNKFSPLDNDYYIHPTGIVEQPCHIGKGTKIWHYSHIMKGAKIGRNCTIGQNVFISSKAEIGDNVKIQNNVSVYDGIKLEDNVFCGPSVVFTNVVNPRSHVSRRNEYKNTLVKKGATLGANSTIICGNIIGEYAFVGGGAVVAKNVPPYALVYGNPARLKGWMCKCGLKLNFKKNRALCTGCRGEYILDNSILKSTCKT